MCVCMHVLCTCMCTFVCVCVCCLLLSILLLPLSVLEHFALQGCVDAVIGELKDNIGGLAAGAIVIGLVQVRKVVGMRDGGKE